MQSIALLVWPIFFADWHPMHGNSNVTQKLFFKRRKFFKREKKSHKKNFSHQFSLFIFSNKFSFETPSLSKFPEKEDFSRPNKVELIPSKKSFGPDHWIIRSFKISVN